MIRIENGILFYKEYGELIESEVGAIKDGYIINNIFFLKNYSFSIERFPEVKEIWNKEWPNGKPEPEVPDPPFPPIVPEETEIEKKVKLLEEQLTSEKAINAMNTQSISDMMDAVFTMLSEMTPPAPTE